MVTQRLGWLYPLLSVGLAISGCSAPHEQQEHDGSNSIVAPFTPEHGDPTPDPSVRESLRYRFTSSVSGREWLKTPNSTYELLDDGSLVSVTGIPRDDAMTPSGSREQADAVLIRYRENGHMLPSESRDQYVHRLKTTTEEYVYGSQSVQDVDEGFDVIITPEDGDGDYEVWVSWPAGHRGCLTDPRPGGDPVMDFREPFAFAWQRVNAS